MIMSIFLIYSPSLCWGFSTVISPRNFYNYSIFYQKVLVGRKDIVFPLAKSWRDISLPFPETRSLICSISGFEMLLMNRVRWLRSIYIHLEVEEWPYYIVNVRRVLNSTVTILTFYSFTEHCFDLFQAK